jgi:pyridoxal phosphate enzyme (YggS family)
VNAGPPSLGARLDLVRGAIARAAERAGRSPGEVRLVGVVKTVPPETVREAVASGLQDLGENRVQEAEVKIAAVGRHAARWHMVGHLQRNKVGRAVELFDHIHSLDRFPLAQALSHRAEASGVRVPVLVEVNVTGEPAKFGVAPAGLEALLEALAALPALSVDGLMTVGRWVERAEDARPTFAALRALREEARKKLGLRLPELSMGMSGDYEVAVEEGATMVRVGTALFGPRS